jgi:hypothetical protein
MGILKRIAAMVRDRRSSPFTVITGPDGEKILVDTPTLEYLNSSAPQPTQAALDSLLDQVSIVRVFKDGCRGNKLLGRDVLLEVGEPNELAALRRSMRITEEAGGHCMCFGGPTLELLSANRSRLALLGIHHGHAIRWDQWRDDARLVDGRSLMEWLARHGVREPLRDFEEQEARRRQRELDRDRWRAATPSALESVWSSDLDPLGDADLAPLHEALLSGMPDVDERILALLNWFGSGAGPWSGFASYEQVAERLLLGYSIERIVSAMESTELGPAQLEGAARLFTGWAFGQRRPHGLREIPDTLRAALWHHVKDMEDQDNLRRATQVLAAPRE